MLFRSVRYIYVGTPTAEFRKQYGAETRIQLDDAFAEAWQDELSLAYFYSHR